MVTVLSYFAIATINSLIGFIGVIFILLTGSNALIVRPVTYAIKIIALCYMTYAIFPLHGVYGNSLTVGLMWILCHIPEIIEMRHAAKGDAYDELNSLEMQKPEKQNNNRIADIIQWTAILVFMISGSVIYGLIDEFEFLGTFFVFVLGNKPVIYVFGILGAASMLYTYKTFVFFRKKLINQEGEMSESIEKLKNAGFAGFNSVAAIRRGEQPLPPHSSGVYIVLRDTDSPREFLKEGTGGFFKGEDPNVKIPTLENKWVEGARVIYIGGTGRTLYSRIVNELVKFGAGEPVGHRGGRYMWQIKDSEQFLVCWKPVENWEEYKSRLLAEFRKRNGGKNPFGNIRDS